MKNLLIGFICVFLVLSIISFLETLTGSSEGAWTVVISCLFCWGVGYCIANRSY